MESLKQVEDSQDEENKGIWPKDCENFTFDLNDENDILREIKVLLYFNLNICSLYIHF